MPDRREFATAALGVALMPAGAAPALRIAYFDRYAPLSSRNTSGAMQGLLVELVDAAGEAAGLRFSHHGYPWQRAQDMVRRGELDGVCTTINAQRLAYLNFCESALLDMNFVVCHRRGDRRIAGLQSLIDMRELRQGNYRGSGYMQANLELEQVQIDHDPDSVLRRIALNDLDVFVDSELHSRLRMRELGLADKLDCSQVGFLPRARYCLALRRSLAGHETLVARLEAATRKLREAGSLERLHQAYRQAS